MYLIVKYQGNEIDNAELFEQLRMSATASKKNPLNEYLTAACTKNAWIIGMNIRRSTGILMQLEYQVDDYLVSITRDSSPAIEKLP